MAAEILFQMGKTVATHGAAEDMRAANVEPATLLNRHMMGDWGNACEAGLTTNAESVLNGGTIIGQYDVGEEEIWVITNADRQLTVMLRPEERKQAEAHAVAESLAEGTGHAE